MILQKIPIETLCELADALSTNTSLEKLYMANTRATDRVARVSSCLLLFFSSLKQKCKFNIWRHEPFNFVYKFMLKFLVDILGSLCKLML